MPFLWGLYDGETQEYWEFCSKGELLAHLETLPKSLIYAHNGGKFDYHYLRDEMNSDQSIMVIAGRLAKFNIGKHEFRDSMNVLNEPLAVFQKEKIDYALLESDVRAANAAEISAYLKSDCVHLWNTLHSYFTRYGSTLTQAGASMREWKRNLVPTFIPQTMHQAERYRKFYYGGRVQCFESGEQRRRFKLIDINSAYPYAMLAKHPFSPVPEFTDRLPKKDELIGPCMLKIEGIAQGCFPLRVEDGSLYFPYDERTKREYFVTGYELLAALKHNAIKEWRCLEIHRFMQLIDFADYIHEHYNKRMDARMRGDKLGDLFEKRFCNGLYGKFASDPEKYNEYLIASDESLPRWADKGYEKQDNWGTRFLMARPLPEEKHRYYNVATAASITGYVRAMLFDASRQVSGLIYCDTDSIAADDIAGLPMGNALGQWKLEMECDAFAVAGKKTYAFRSLETPSKDDAEKKRLKFDSEGRCWKTASKGVDLTVEQTIDAANGRPVHYDPKVPTYSMMRPAPLFIPRTVRNTARDISRLP